MKTAPKVGAVVTNLYFTGYADVVIGDSIESTDCELYGIAPFAPAALAFSPPT